MQLHRNIDRIIGAGGELVVIGNGAPNFIAGFRDETGFSGALYTDPTLKAFEAAQLERGLGRTLDPRALGPTVRAFARGHRQGRTQGDALQQGGVLIIDKTGVVRWQHVSRRPGDNASVDDIVAALARKSG